MGTITRKIYKHSSEHFTLAQWLMTPTKTETFPFEGHNWRYSHSSFDDEGDYLVIYRFDDDGPDIAAEDMTLFHALLCNAVAGLCANATLLDEILETGRKNDAPSLIAADAYDVAMEAYNLVRSRR